jgi:hypothetical protein
VEQGDTVQTLRLKSYKTIPGEQYGTPKEVWGFRARVGRGSPQRVARAVLRSNAPLLGLPGIHSRLSVQRVVHSLGATHVILQQRHRGIPIFRAYVTVHIGRDGRMYLIKNRAVPREFLEERGRFKLGVSRARSRALRAIGAGKRGVTVMGAEKRWFPVDDAIRPAYRVRLHREAPREEWIVYVNAATGGVLSKYDNLASTRGVARVFDPNPVVALGDWTALLSATGRPRRPPDRAYSAVSLEGLGSGDRLDGRRVTTSPTPNRVRRADHRFLFDSVEPGFLEVMAYFHVNRAIRHLESLGYRGQRAIFRAPIPVNASGTRDDNSWYSPGLRSLTFGTGGVDDAEDAEIILHEFGHALQDAICPDFGQSTQAAAMGEGFGDYFAASFFAAMKPAALRPLLMSWDSIADTDHRPPYLRRVNEPLTFESFDHGPEADEHDNGRIWSATLWDIRTAVGRDVADRIIIDSHFQLDGFTTFARGARAVLDADRNLYHGRHLPQLRKIFQDRGIGPVA